MTVLTTSTLSNAVRARYIGQYLMGARMRRLYDQLSVPVSAPQFDLERTRGMGTSYVFPFISDMAPGTTTISQTADITPQVLRDATASVTPTSRGEALKWSELLDLEAYTDLMGARARLVGDNAMETIENLAIASALQGSVVIRATARASLDAGTTTHNLTEAEFWKAMSIVEDMKMPVVFDPSGTPMRMAIMHPDAFYDLFHGGNILTSLQYGGLPGVILLNGEIGSVAGWRIVKSAWAKVFFGAGADNGTAGDYALSAAANALDKTLSITTATNVASGRWLNLGTEETANTFYDTNERVKHISGTTTSTIVGSGANGGIRFDHVITDHVNNNDSVYPVVFGVPGSLVKVFASEVGAFGQLVGPKFDGIANQWQSLAWKFYGGYGRVGENRLVRGEYSTSLEA